MIQIDMRALHKPIMRNILVQGAPLAEDLGQPRFLLAILVSTARRLLVEGIPLHSSTNSDSDM